MGILYYFVDSSDDSCQLKELIECIEHLSGLYIDSHDTNVDSIAFPHVSGPGKVLGDNC